MGPRGWVGTLALLVSSVTNGSGLLAGLDGFRSISVDAGGNTQTGGAGGDGSSPQGAGGGTRSDDGGESGGSAGGTAADAGSSRPSEAGAGGEGNGTGGNTGAGGAPDSGASRGGAGDGGSASGSGGEGGGGASSGGQGGTAPCDEGTHRCEDATSELTCDDQGEWSASDFCTVGCVGDRCASGCPDQLLPPCGSGPSALPCDPVNADDSALFCFPSAAGLDDMCGEPPQWSATSTAPRTEVADPRWVGATRYDFGLKADTGTEFAPDAAQASFRGVTSGSLLLIQYLVTVDPSGIGPNDDAVYIGFARRSGEGYAYLARISPQVVGDLVAGDAANVDLVYLRRNADGTDSWVTQSLPPALRFVEDVGLWVDATNHVWTLNVQIDLVRLQYSADPFKMFHAVVVHHKQSPPPVSSSTQYARPFTTLFGNRFDTTPGATVTELADIYPPDWGNVALDAVCEDGVQLYYGDIGTTQANPGDVSTTSDNTFIAAPRLPSSIPATDMIATFRFANVGSDDAGADADWQELARVEFSSDGQASWTCHQQSGPDQCPQPGPDGETPALMVELASQVDPLALSKSSAWRQLAFVE